MISPGIDEAGYLDPRRIYISAKSVIEPAHDELEWGRQFLTSLNLRDAGAADAARSIQREVSTRFGYKIQSPRTIAAFVSSKGGNCVSHTMMGLLLLRLAGIPARLCYEFHVRDHFALDQWRANREKAAHFGVNHNSHFWVMFLNGAEWQPYDSALGLAGFNEFFAVRTKTQRWPYWLSFNPRKMTGAPFIIERETGLGRTGSENITREIWDRDFVWGNEKVSRDEWLCFVKSFEGSGTAAFTFPLDAETQDSLLRMSRAWF